jgi:hypothetical protein
MKKKSSLALFILWLVTGIVTLIAGPTRFAYGCVWILLLINYLIEAFIGDYLVGYKEGAKDAIDSAIEDLERYFDERKKKREEERKKLHDDYM